MFIMFFALLAQAQAEAGQRELALESLRQVQTILNTQQASTDTYSIVPIPGGELRHECSVGDGLLQSQINIEGYAADMQHALVAGRDMNVNVLTLFSKQVRAPYPIGNVLLVSSPREGFRADYSGLPAPVREAVRQEFEMLLPEPIRNGPSGGEGYDTNRDVRFVTSFSSSGAPAGNTRRIEILYRSGENVFEKGTVRLWEYNRQGNPTGTHKDYEYVGEGMLLAYIWQADVTRANCMQYKLMARLAQISELHANRIQDIAGVYGVPDENGNTNQQCLARLRPTQVRALQTYAEGIRDNLLAGSSVSTGQLEQLTKDVEDKNEQLLRGVRCASIY